MDTASGKAAHYHVKSVAPIMIGENMQARLFTLAPGEVIPWHYHTESTDRYFVLEGALTILMHNPERQLTIATGGRHEIVPRRAHLITNRSNSDCRFLLLQGFGKQDWVKVGAA